MRNNGNVVAAVPFTAAAHEHVEPAFTINDTITAAVQQLNPINLPAFGFLRAIWLDIDCNNGAAGVGAVAGEDYPFSLIESVTLIDVNGAPIVGPIDGYALYLANLFGGYAFQQDARAMTNYSNDASNPRFQIRVPIEIAHYNALGALANQNAASPYQLSISLAASTDEDVWTDPPDTLPDVTITGYLECWTLPAATDVSGRPQEQLPPAHGTGQFWSSRTVDVLAGSNTVQVTRVGNLIRNLIFIGRDSSGERSNSVFPEPILINWDGRQLKNESQVYRRNIMKERLLLDGTTDPDTGVFAYTFNHSSQNKSGDDTPNLWLPTVQSTRLEVNGSFAAAGSLQVLVNDIQPIEVNPAARFAESNATSPTAGGQSRTAKQV